MDLFHFTGEMGKVRHMWREENMKMAVEKVRLMKMTIREASERFSVPKSTLGDRLKNILEGKEIELKPKLGNSTDFAKTFSDEQEQVLYAHIKNLDNQLMPLNKEEFLKLAYRFAEKLKIKHRFNKEKLKAGKDFYYDFMKRHPDLRLRTAESTSLQRAVGFSKEQVDRFFDTFSQLMDKYKFSPSKIFNADETGVTSVHTNRLKVMSVKGKKQVGKLTSGERGRNVTVLLSINAAGDMFIPPLFVFPRVRMDNDLTKDAPAGSVFDAQPSGWITKDSFLKWLVLFVERVNPTEESPALLIVDGHSSHKDLDVITFAKQHHIHMLSIPPHTSHKLQPLDRTVMKPFKNAYHEACSCWMRQYPNIKITLKDIAGLVSSAFSRICRMELAKSGFECTGIYPMNRNLFSDLDYAPSLNNESTGESSTSSGPCSSSAILPGPSSAFAPGSSSAAISSPGPSSATSSPASSLAHHLSPHSSSTLPDPSNHDPAIESPKISPSQQILEEISPLPSQSSSKFASRQNRGEKSEVLTSTPYKKQLEVKKEQQEKRQKASEAKRKLREEKRKEKEEKKKEQASKTPVCLAKTKRLTKRNMGWYKRKDASATEREISSESARKKLTFDDKDTGSDGVTHCIICDETFEEDWIQCRLCNGWAHENCADLESSALYYECDSCFLNKKQKLC